MTARTILQWPNANLLKKSSYIDFLNFDVVSTAEDLYHTMISNFGAGLAAPQVGIHKNMCVILPSYVPSLSSEKVGTDGECVVLINPFVEHIGKEKFTWEEACLSVPNMQAKVIRSQKIRLTYQNLSGEERSVELEDIESATVQHEVDHLEGKLYIHRLRGMTRQSVLKKLRKSIVAKKRSSSLKQERQTAGSISEAKRIELRKKRKKRKKATRKK